MIFKSFVSFLFGLVAGIQFCYFSSIGKIKEAIVIAIASFIMSQVISLMIREYMKQKYYSNFDKEKC